MSDEKLPPEPFSYLRLVPVRDGSRPIWEPSAADKLREVLEDAIARDDRVLVFSIRRGQSEGEPVTVSTAFSDRRSPCAITWPEFIGTLAIRLHQWIAGTDDDT